MYSRINFGTSLNRSSVGKYTYLGDNVSLNMTIIGNYCSIAPGAMIGGMEHSWWWGSTSPQLSDKNIVNRETVIADDVWIGSNAVIRQGIRIGRGAVVGAGSVVLHDIPPYTIVVGVPAREIKKRFSDDVITQITATKFWEYPPSEARAFLDNIKYH